MLIVEGPDLVGKTTLAKKLTSKLNECGWPHVHQHLGRLPECARHDIQGMYRRLMNPYVVRDRFHYSEPLYAAIREEAPLLGPSNYNQVERELRSYGSFLIVITAEPELIEERHAISDREEMYDLPHILKVNELYVQAASSGHHGAYAMPHDLWLHCTRESPWVEFGEHLRLHSYLNRLDTFHPYPGSSRRIA